MTSWKERALEAEKTLADAREQLSIFYCTSASVAVAKNALLKLRELLGVDNARKPGVPDSLTREVSYMELGKHE